MACECDEQGIFDFPCAFAGCSFVGFEITIEEDEEDAQVDLVNAVIEFKNTPDLEGASALTLSTEDGGLTIVSAAPPWVIAVDDIAAVSLAAGVYFFDIKTTDSAANTEAYCAGKWRVNPAT